MKIVFAGAGSIGCFCGALLAKAGHDVTLLGRARILDPIRAHGLTATDFSGLHCHIPANGLKLTENPDCLAEAEVVIVTVKTSATSEVAAQIRQRTPKTAPVLSWQNGIENARTLRAALADHEVRAGMVPFNVVPSDNGCFHRATSGEIVIESGPNSLGAQLSVAGLPVLESDDIEAVQWGKLLINLNNALNALSGLTIREQLLNRKWRRLMADQMVEAMAVLKMAGIPVTMTTPLPAWLVPWVLRLPTPLFLRVAARMLTIDPNARSSMSYDLDAGRATEIDSFQGEIIRLGARFKIPTPICESVCSEIKIRPSTAISADEIVSETRSRERRSKPT